jgi:GNAT superfamily N-acetyltransferase
MGSNNFDGVRPFDFHRAPSDQQDEFLNVLSGAYPDDEVAELWDNDDQMAVGLYLPKKASLLGALVMGTDFYPDLWISRLAVRPEAQGLGLGRLAIEFAELYALNDQFPFESIKAKTWMTNREALGFYARMGFVQDEDEDAGYITMIKPVE